MGYNGTLVWEDPPPKQGLNLSLIPYLTGRRNADYQDAAAPALKGDAGLNAKYAVTPSLNLDVTFNPDFSQVEVDRQVTNLNRFELFFPERRLFFIENSDLFSKFGFSQIRPFFSRRVGLYNRQSVPIWGGARLSGKIGQNWRIGAMNMQQREQPGRNLAAQNFSVAAFQRRVFEQSNFGMIFVNRQTVGEPDSAFNHNRYNRVVGGDFNLFSNNNHWEGKAFYHQSFTPVQPSDAMAHAVWLRYFDRYWDLNYNHEYVGTNYSAETGFVPRKGYIRFEPIGRRWLYTEGDRINRMGIAFNGDLYLNKQMEVIDGRINPGYEFEFQNSARFKPYANYYFRQLRTPFDPTNTDGEELPQGSTYQWSNIGFNWDSNARNPFFWGAGFIYGGFYNGNRLRYNFDLRYRWTPYANFKISFRQNRLWLPDPYKTTTLTLISPEVDITFTENIYLSIFSQYNTQQKNMNINARFQWRFLPLSDLFVVVTDNYLTPELNVKNRSIVVKVNYWFTP
jgi:hypothetical protein